MVPAGPGETMIFRAHSVHALIAGGLLAGGLSLAAPAVATITLFPADGMARQAAGSDRTDLLRRWVSVGRCVVGRDRASAIAFVNAPAGSDDSIAAARRLDPVFVGCLAGSRVPGPSSVVLRRAAVANALGQHDRT